jgi:carbon monoxide dehydrogenase subunit G
MGRNTAGINATQAVDPDRFQRNIPGLQDVAAKIEAMNAHLASMTSAAAVNATIMDARQDNRQFPVTVNPNSTIQVTQTVEGAAAAVAGTINNGIKAGVTAQPARMHFEGR